MKPQLFLVVALMLMVASSCKKDETDKENAEMVGFVKCYDKKTGATLFGFRAKTEKGQHLLWFNSPPSIFSGEYLLQPPSFNQTSIYSIDSSATMPNGYYIFSTKHKVMLTYRRASSAEWKQYELPFVPFKHTSSAQDTELQIVAINIRKL